MKALGSLHNFGRCDEEHDGRRIYKTTDQPWAGDAVDLRSLPRHPDGAATPVPLWDLVGGNGRQLRLLPGDMTAFEDFGCDFVVTKPGRRAFAEFLALLADDDRGLAG